MTESAIQENYSFEDYICGYCDQPVGGCNCQCNVCGQSGPDDCECLCIECCNLQHSGDVPDYTLLCDMCK